VVEPTSVPAQRARLSAPCPAGRLLRSRLRSLAPLRPSNRLQGKLPTVTKRGRDEAGSRERRAYPAQPLRLSTTWRRATHWCHSVRVTPPFTPPLPIAPMQERVTSTYRYVHSRAGGENFKPPTWNFQVRTLRTNTCAPSRRREFQTAVLGVSKRLLLSHSFRVHPEVSS
jgi:hypothetical protein